MTAWLCMALTVLCAGCDQAGSSASAELPRPTEVPSQVFPFSGTLQPGGTNAHSFTVSQSGYVEVTLLGLGAPSSTTVGLGIGTASATSTCALISKVTTGAGTAAQLIGTGLAGSLCVVIFDVGNLTGPTLYTMTVASS